VAKRKEVAASSTSREKLALDLTAKQKQALIDAGISPYVAAEMTRINEPEKNRVLANAPSK